MAIKYLQCFNKVTPRINITYKCNMFSYCKYCYSKEELKTYKNDMTVENFQKIIIWFKELFDIVEVVFLGGESTTHPKLEEIGEVLNDENIGCFLFTNGCFTKDKQEIIKKIDAFHTVFFHYEPEFLNNQTIRKIFLKNIEEISKTKNIIFRYNTDNPDFDYSELIYLAKTYNASIAYSFTSPSLNREIDYVKIDELKKFVPQLKKFILAAEKNHIDIFDKRPLPLCIFDDKDENFAKKIGVIRYVCCNGSICVNPDLTLIAAPTLTTIKTSSPKNKQDLYDKVELLQSKVEELKWQIPTINKCIKCKHWKNHVCQGGCTTYKIC